MGNIIWDEQGQPHSEMFDDKYFCAEDGLAEAKYIFCDGNELEKRWKNIPQDSTGTFRIAELGFGTGLNFLCAWQLWQQQTLPNWTLEYVSIDRFPLKTADLIQALNLWSELKDLAGELIEKYDPSDSQEIFFPQDQLRLVLIYEDILKGLERCKGPVDAWFLDGFAPAKNPEMWSNEVFTSMSNISYDKTTLSTFTVAGTVCRGLKSQGFEINKAKGFDRKRHMLKGNFKGV